MSTESDSYVHPESFENRARAFVSRERPSWQRDFFFFLPYQELDDNFGVVKFGRKKLRSVVEGEEVGESQHHI